MQDTDGSGRDLLQYSYVLMKNDLLHWMKEIGRLPSSTMSEHYEDLKELNQLREKLKKHNQLKKELSEARSQNVKQETELLEAKQLIAQYEKQL